MEQSVGIVLVSHSDGLAAGLRDLLAQIGSDRVPVAAAGGTADGRIGTSYERILGAIGEADRGAGVLILPDLGSSVLTTMAVLEDNPRTDIRLVDAPFVEGAVAAAVAASGGADLEAVAGAARRARETVKFDAPDAPQPESAPSVSVVATARSTGGSASADVLLPANLHARPAGRLAQEATKYASEVRLEYAGKSINPTGVLAVMSLGATLGSTVTLRAVGDDAAAAVEALAKILAEAE